MRIGGKKDPQQNNQLGAKVDERESRAEKETANGGVVAARKRGTRKKERKGKGKGKRRGVGGSPRMTRNFVGCGDFKKRGGYPFRWNKDM